MIEIKRRIQLSAIGLLFFSVLTAPVTAGVPEPMCIFYGQAKDAFGWPYTSSAEVILRSGTNEYARCTVNGSLAPGVNFALYVHLDSGDGETYSPYALHPGDRVEIVIRDTEGERSIMETNVPPPVGLPGETILVNVTAGTDSDRDGLPDEWEEYLVEAGGLSSIWEIRPQDDFDKDGQSNLDEYLAGTFAFLDYDYFRIEERSVTSNGWIRLHFLTTPGKIYWVEATDDLAAGSWEPAAFAATEGGPLREVPLIGDGYWRDIFLPPDAAARFFRLKVK